MPAKPKFRIEFIEQARVLTQLGATDNELAEFFKVAVRTINAWKVEHPDFGKALRVGKDEADERVKRSLYHNACGYTFEDVKIFCNKDGVVTEVPYTAIKHPDTVACIFWLKNRQPEQWRENFEREQFDKAKLQELLAAVEGRLAEPASAPEAAAGEPGGKGKAH